MGSFGSFPKIPEGPDKTVKAIVTAGSVVGFVAFLLAFPLTQYLIHISPTAPDPATGHICSLNEHGYIFYVTTIQAVVFHTLLIGGFSLGACGAVIRLWLDHRVR
jgi:hypothetical protein